jgi:16S rRNA (adenine1518-N6/adenine1519-N6)-dimethyltransferase
MSTRKQNFRGGKQDDGTVRAKKHLGQHFLTDKNMCRKIAEQYQSHFGCKRVLEVGPGMGAITQYILEKKELDVKVMEIDWDSVAFLKANYPQLEDRVIEADFLKSDLNDIFDGEQFAVVGNFPYNISSQIVFKCIEYRDLVPEIMGMFQKEMAMRIAEKPGSKVYGIISVLTQAFYDIEYCFTVDAQLFNPPPKVQSGVIRCTRNSRDKLPCNEKLFIQVVKIGFNQRRKTLRNSLKGMLKGNVMEQHVFTLRPEVLSVEDFIELTNIIDALEDAPQKEEIVE